MYVYKENNDTKMKRDDWLSQVEWKERGGKKKKRKLKSTQSGVRKSKIENEEREREREGSIDKTKSRIEKSTKNLGKATVTLKPTLNIYKCSN